MSKQNKFNLKQKKMKNLFITVTFILTFCSIANANQSQTIVKDLINLELFSNENDQIHSNNLSILTNFNHTPSMFVGIDWKCLVASVQVYTAYTNIGMDPIQAQQIANGVYLGCTGQLPGR